jgi:RimJ/RimL family protein N-acetyltransferase
MERDIFRCSMHAWTVETPRLRLREMTRKDLDFVATMLAHPDVSRYYDRQFARSDAEAWIDKALTRYRDDGHGLWLVTERETGRPVGQVGIVTQEVEGERHAELGWLLHRPFWGNGYATEAAYACRDAAFRRWRYDHVISLIRPENEASVRVAQRLGLREARRVRFHGFDHLLFWQAAAGDGAEL